MRNRTKRFGGERSRRVPVVAGAVALLGGLLPFSGVAASPASAATSVVSYPVTFTVVNQDKALLFGQNNLAPLSPGDGKTYQVHGHITAPAGAIDLPNRSAALYVSGHGYGEWFWHLTSVPAYDYATNQAKAGLTSVTIDKIGYGATAKPATGTDVGFGTEATVDHQILGELRSGQYSLSGHAPVAFSRLALVGGTQAAFAAEVEQYSFPKDVNGLILAGFADEGFSVGLLANYATNVVACNTTATAAGNGYPPEYAYREVGNAQFVSDNLHGADTSPAVTQVAESLHSEDPCGYPTYSVGDTLVENTLLGPTITAPVLSVMGADDSEFLPSVALAYQKVEFALNPDATTDLLPNTPQALTLGTTAPVFTATMAQWLCARQFGAYSGSCKAPVSTAAAVTPAAPAATSTAAATGAATGATSTGPAAATGATLPVTGANTLHELAVAATLLLLGGTVVGLSTVRVRRRLATGGGRTT